MKIALMATMKVPFPMSDSNPELYFSPLKVALDIAEGLTKKGHNVTFFGPRGSSSDSFKVQTVPVDPIYTDKKLLSMEGTADPELAIKDKERMLILFEQYLLDHVFKTHQIEKYDVIHLHVADAGLPFGVLAQPPVPVVYTLHEALYPWREKLFETFQTGSQSFVSISNSQRNNNSKINWNDTVYNGVDLEDFPFSDRPGDQLLFLGRLLQRKGVSEAIEVAQKMQKKLLIAGSPNSGEFWDKEIQPHLKEGSIEHLGFVPYKEGHKHYGASKVVLLPIQWDEPFGLVMIEAMACGTPVVAFRRGSVPEVIKDGETGFIVEPGDVDGMIRATKQIYDMPEDEYQAMRRACREHVKKNFTVERMVDGYEAVYEKARKDWTNR